MCHQVLLVMLFKDAFKVSYELLVQGPPFLLLGTVMLEEVWVSGVSVPSEPQHHGQYFSHCFSMEGSYIMLTAGLGFRRGFTKGLAGLGWIPVCCSSNLTPLT